MPAKLDVFGSSCCQRPTTSQPESVKQCLCHSYCGSACEVAAAQMVTVKVHLHAPLNLSMRSDSRRSCGRRVHPATNATLDPLGSVCVGPAKASIPEPVGEEGATREEELGFTPALMRQPQQASTPRRLGAGAGPPRLASPGVRQVSCPALDLTGPCTGEGGGERGEVGWGKGRGDGKRLVR